MEKPFYNPFLLLEFQILSISKLVETRVHQVEVDNLPLS